VKYQRAEFGFWLIAHERVGASLSGTPAAGLTFKASSKLSTPNSSTSRCELSSGDHAPEHEASRSTSILGLAANYSARRTIHQTLCMARRRKRRAARSAKNRPERQQDPRLVAAQVTAGDNREFTEGDWVLVVSPVDLNDGRRLMWYPPQAVTFNLLQAKSHRDRGTRRRRAIMGNLAARPDGAYGPSNSHATVDCLAELVAAVLFSFTAVESFANHVIDMLPDETLLLAGGKRNVAKHDLVRSLGIDDKFKRAIPLLEEARAIAGDHDVWQRYQALKFLRDELVHVKSRGYDPDPTVLTAYDRLLVGEADDCVEDARAVIDAAFPSFIPQWVASRLTGPQA
jgi:hypothetical protein